jgi:metal-responsive CopG/Arc/MetJ family transcriptional regulator
MTISLPTAMLAKIEHARQAEDRTRSEFVRQAIRVYLARGDSERRVAGTDDGALDGAKGREREAAGALAEDELRDEVSLEQADGRVKDAAGTTNDRGRGTLRGAKDRF